MNDSSTGSLLRHFSKWDGRHARFMINTMTVDEILYGIPQVLPLPQVMSGQICVVSVVDRSSLWIDTFTDTLSSLPPENPQNPESTSPLDVMVPAHLLAPLRQLGQSWKSSSAPNKAEKQKRSSGNAPSDSPAAAPESEHHGWPILPPEFGSVPYGWIASQASAWNISQVPFFSGPRYSSLAAVDATALHSDFAYDTDHSQWLLFTAELGDYLQIRVQTTEAFEPALTPGWFAHRLCTPLNNCLLDALAPHLQGFQAFRTNDSSTVLRQTLALFILSEASSLAEVKRRVTGAPLDLSLVLRKGSLTTSMAMDPLTWIDDFDQAILCVLGSFNILTLGFLPSSPRRYGVRNALVIDPEFPLVPVLEGSAHFFGLRVLLLFGRVFSRGLFSGFCHSAQNSLKILLC